jgi:hypothetical protein
MGFPGGFPEAGHDLIFSYPPKIVLARANARIDCLRCLNAGAARKKSRRRRCGVRVNSSSLFMWLSEGLEVPEIEWVKIVSDDDDHHAVNGRLAGFH